MPPAFNPAWLLLLFCGVALLVGCTALYTRTPITPPTDYPPVTLTVYTALPLVSPIVVNTPLQPPLHTLPSLSPPYIPPLMTTAPPNIIVDPPACYELTSRGWLCLGRVRNLSDEIVGHVRLRVATLTREGDIQSSQPVVLEQRSIQPQGFAPYRAIFYDIDARTSGAMAQIEAIETRQPSPSERNPLNILDERGEYIQNATHRTYVITATLENTGQDAVKVRAIGSLSNEQGQLVGYRVEDLPDVLAPHQRQALQIEIVPQAGDTIQHHLTVEAWTQTREASDVRPNTYTGTPDTLPPDN